jgi:hypothetical protein
MVNKHITRDLDANRTNRISYRKDQYKVERYTSIIRQKKYCMC